MIHGVRRGQAVMPRHRQREKLIRILTIGVFCVMPVLAVINSSAVNSLQAALASTRTAGENTAQPATVTDQSGGIDIARPENSPFNLRAQPAARTFPGDSSMNSATPYIGETATYDRLTSTPERDPFMPPVVAYVSAPGTPGGATTPAPDEDNKPTPGQDLLKLINTYLADNQARAYVYYNGDYFDVTVGDKVNDHPVMNIDHHNGRIALEKDGKAYIIAAESSIK